MWGKNKTLKNEKKRKILIFSKGNCNFPMDDKYEKKMQRARMPFFLFVIGLVCHLNRSKKLCYLIGDPGV